MPVLGEIRAFWFNFAPRGFMACDGALLNVKEHMTLFALLGTAFGGDGTTTFGLPDLRGRAIIGTSKKAGEYPMGHMVGQETVTLSEKNIPSHMHQVYVSTSPGTRATGGDAYFAVPGVAKTETETIPIYSPFSSDVVALHKSTVGVSGTQSSHSNMQPFAVVSYYICTEGAWPSRVDDNFKIDSVTLNAESVTEGFLGEIRLFAGVRLPRGWAHCDGRAHNINSLDTDFVSVFQGDNALDSKEFKMPDLRGRVPIGVGSGLHLTPRKPHETGGAREVLADLPGHTHTFQVVSHKASSREPKDLTLGSVVASGNIEGLYCSNKHTDTVMASKSVEMKGDNSLHSNMMPSVALHYIICIKGGNVPVRG